MNHKYTRSGSVLMSFVPLIILGGLQTFISFAVSLLYVLARTSSLPMNDWVKMFDRNGMIYKLSKEIMNTDFIMIISCIYAVAGIAVFLTWYLRRIVPAESETIRGRTYPTVPKNGFSLKNGMHPLMIPGLFILALGLQYMANYIVMIITVINPDIIKSYQQIMEKSGLEKITLTLPLVLYVVILGPICEELAFRGVTFGYISRSLPFQAANIFQASLFGIMHMNITQGIYAFFLGLFLGEIYYHSGNILLNIFLHMGFNAISLFLSDYLTTGNGTPYVFCLILFAAMCATYLGRKLTLYVIDSGKK